MKTLKVLSLGSMLALVAFAAGCGGPPAPPVELTNARAEVVRAQKGPAAQLDPAGVHEATVALANAEKAWSDSHDDPNAVDLAVIAQTRAQSAESRANAIQAANDKAQAEATFQANQTAKLQATQGALASAQGDLGKTREDLERERNKRAEVEARLQNAQNTLNQIATVKQDDRGTVLTISGETLFKTNKSDLLPGAMVKLDKVADTLKGQERKIIVAGYTDSTGTADFNQGLSQRRAQAVADYLVTKGIPHDLVSAEGRSSAQPVADNGTVEGRAMNRRVEIIVQPATVTNSTSTTTTTTTNSSSTGSSNPMPSQK